MVLLVTAVIAEEPEPADLSRMTTEDIAALTKDQKNALTAEQLKYHLEKIGDLHEFKNAGTALEAKFGTKILDLASGARLTGTILTATTGQRETINLSQM